MATTRKITSKGIAATAPLSREKVEAKKEAPKRATKAVEETTEGEEGKKPSVRLKKVCQFCTNKTEPHYFDTNAIRRFINDRGRIVIRTRSGCCAKHQRRVTREIKRARHLSLLPFTVRV